MSVPSSSCAVQEAQLSPKYSHPKYSPIKVLANQFGLNYTFTVDGASFVNNGTFVSCSKAQNVIFR